MDSQQPSPTRKTPTWVWVLGGGCALVVLVGLGAVVFTLRFVAKASDPELQWPKLAPLVAPDEPPEGWTITGLPLPGSDGEIFTLHPPGATDQITLSRYPAREAAQFRKALFEEVELEADAPLVGPVGRFDPVRGTLEVQGRKLLTLRYFTTPAVPEQADGLLGAIQSAAATSNLVVDLSPDPEGDLFVLEIRRQGERTPIPDAELIELLQAFRIGAHKP